ncbi:MAG: hypothetical protein ROO76_16030 [Terriglobia bacterium]|jgi:hypothetical protein|nr:hypothetical protein [Terriglobia bacterium]
MKTMKKGLLVGLIHVLLVSSLGAKLLIDRATRPRIWLQSVSYDPNLPIRGRYVALRAVVETDVPAARNQFSYPQGLYRLEVRDGKLWAIKDPRGTQRLVWTGTRDGKGVTALAEPSLFFIPDNASDPSIRKAGEQLWFEATIPTKGPPRPIRLAVSKPDGTFAPIEMK